jgi:thymidylate synthase
MDEMVYKNSTDAFLIYLAKVKHYGNIVSPRGMETKELLSQRIVITNPTQRCIVLPERNDDIVAKVAETLWQLAGRNDIEWLSWYLPRAPEFSDNGYSWRGAYGPRLREWDNADPAYHGSFTDQIEAIARKLRKDPDTRQAVISIWNPELDLLPGKDIPCNNWLHFFIREGELHLNIAQRSSDVVWGFSGIDAFSWSVLHEMMASWTNTEVGDFTYFISSLHVYDRHYKKLDKILEAYADRTIYDFDLPSVEYDGYLVDLDVELDAVFSLEAKMRSVNSSVLKAIEEWEEENELFYTFLLILAMGNYVKVHEDYVPVHVARFINAMPESDFRVAAVEWMSRRDLSVLPHLRLRPLEKQALSNVVPSIATKLP